MPQQSTFSFFRAAIQKVRIIAPKIFICGNESGSHLVSVHKIGLYFSEF